MSRFDTHKVLFGAILWVGLMGGGCQGTELVDSEKSATSHGMPPIRVAVVGADFGHQAAHQVFKEGDLQGSSTFVDIRTFNNMSVMELRAYYDVLLFPFASPKTLDADWEKLLLPFLKSGGGIVFEDPGNGEDLVPGVRIAPRFPFTGTFRVAEVPGLTHGVTSQFVNNHMAFTSWDEHLGPYLWVNDQAVGLYGGFPGGGRLVVTGVDLHFHGRKHSSLAAERNQYALMRNEICWAAGCVNQAPVVNAGAEQTVECAGALTQVLLDGSASFDTDRDVLSYRWSGPFVPREPSLDPQAMVHLPRGDSSIALFIDDGHGASSTGQVTIHVVDTSPPVVQLPVQSTGLWSPDHKMYLVASAVSAVDACDGRVATSVLVSSNEVEDGQGDGHTAPDWQVMNREDGSFDVWLRSERSGPGSGRTYTLTITAKDSSLNTTTATAQVRVAPHP